MLKKILFISIQLQFNPILIARALRAVPNYLRDVAKFRRLEQNWSIRIYPALLDRSSESAELGEYFWQDLFVAKKIIAINPKRHIDVGSRIDGFIAHLACIRKVEVFDIRPLTKEIMNVQFVQWDVTNPNPNLNGVSDCVSCLHTLEHIGLGRYGDNLDANGWKKGLKSLVELIAHQGELWISVPIGIQRVEFNAHRVFDPESIFQELVKNNMKLQGFYYINNDRLVESNDYQADFLRLKSKNYSLGIFNCIKS